MTDGFDMTYSQDAELGHAFAAVYEWVIEGRSIPVVPIFVNTYLPPLPTARRCAQLGAAIRDAILKSPYRIAIVASGGMSHYPGAWKYPQPAFDFDWWAIAHMERGNNNALLELNNEQLDEVGNTEMLPWMILFGAIGQQPGELITYQPTWHHGHAVMRFIPNKKGTPTTPEPAAEIQLRQRGGLSVLPASRSVGVSAEQAAVRSALQPAAAPPLVREHAGSGVRVRAHRNRRMVLETMKDESIDAVRSLKPHPLVEAGAHPLGMWMSLITVQAEQRRMRAEQAQATAVK